MARTFRLQGPLWAILALGVGFALVDTAALRRGFEAVAVALAAAATAVFNLAGLETVRSGSALRAQAAGWGMEVTRVCDGHGLTVALLALAAAAVGAGLRSGKTGLAVLAGGLLAIQAFNLLRILVLGAVLDRAPGAFEAVHLGIFPLLTGGLFVLAAAMLGRCPARRMGLALALAAALSALWLGLAAGPLARALVPAANLLLGWVAPGGIGPIAARPAGWVVETLLVAGVDPLTLHRALIVPADFALALPLLLAAALAARTARAWGGLALGVALMAVALALGAMSEVRALALAEPVLGLLSPLPDGSFDLVPFATADTTAAAGLRLAQNVIVHFNLLILPGLLLWQQEPADG